MTEIKASIAAIRAFNRFYTAHVGALDEHLLNSPFTLAEARVVYELGHRKGVTAAALAKDLDLDPAYLSRILRRLSHAGLVARLPNPQDGRGRVLSLTAEGRDEFERLVQASCERIGQIVEPLTSQGRAALLRAMGEIRRLLAPEAAQAGPVVIRSHRMGDIGWIVHRHATLYRDEYGWDARFEALVAEIAADFLKSHDPACEHCWVAERDGQVLGSVFLVDAGDGVAKLRLLYVEPSARGARIGLRLAEECIGFARRAGYRRMTLWTNDVLVAARRLYDALGFELVTEIPHSDFGPPMVGQVLERDL